MGYQVRTIEHVMEKAPATIPLVVVNHSGTTETDPEKEARSVNERIGLHTGRLFLDVLNRERAWTLVLAERKLAQHIGESAVTDSLRRIHVTDVTCLSDSKVEYITPSRNGAWAELPTETVEVMGKMCDVAIRFGFGLVTGAILDAPKYGVISYHPADIRQYRGLGTPQAWLDGCDVMGVTLQRLSTDIDGGEIVAYKEVDVSSSATLWDVYATLYALYPELLVEGLRTLRDPSADISVPDSLGPYYSIKSRRRLGFATRTLLKNTTGRLKKTVNVDYFA